MEKLDNGKFVPVVQVPVDESVPVPVDESAQVQDVGYNFEAVDEVHSADSSGSQSNSLERPVGVFVLGALNIVGGIIFFFLALSALGESGGSDAAGAGLFLVGLAVYQVVVGAGMLNLRPWARYLAIAGYVINVVFGLAGLPGSFLMLIVAGLILTYLFSERVRRAFTSEGF